MKKILGNKAGVTLMELMIVMVIIGILSVVLFRTFGSVSELTFRIQQQKDVWTEIITASQIIQNYADRNHIDYERYSGLALQNWMSDTLYLSGIDGQIAMYSSWDCIELWTTPLSWLQDRSCSLYVENNEDVFTISNPAKIYFSKILFKIIPFASEENYIASPELCEQDNLINCINAPGFWILAEAYNARYKPGQRGNTIKIPVQEFFNLK